MPKRTDAVLKEASRHVIFEWVQILHNTDFVNGIASGRFAPVEASKMTALKNALVESFTVHARSLHHFFHSSNASKDDVLAEHFIPGWATTVIPWPTTLDEMKFRVNKQIAHLTYSRLEFSAAEAIWPGDAIVHELEVRIIRFTQLVRRELLHEDWFTMCPPLRGVPVAGGDVVILPPMVSWSTPTGMPGPVGDD